jgi:hypothetical protein
MAGFFSTLFKPDNRAQKAILEQVDQSRQELTRQRSRLEETISEFLDENDRLNKRTPRHVSKHRS